MRRRTFTILTGGATLWPLFARAQQRPAPVIGVLGGTSPRSNAATLPAFIQGLAEAGYVDGRNVAIEYRWADGHYERLSALAAELVDRGVAVIAALTTPAAQAAKSATSTIPIVFYGSDPVALRLVESLSRPGGNMTGVNTFVAGLDPKQFELLQEIVGKPVVFGFLDNPMNPNAEIQLQGAQEGARTVGRQIIVARASIDDQLGSAFAQLAEHGVGALLVSGDAFFSSRREQIVALAAHHALPASYQLRAWVDAGGLMSYDLVLKTSTVRSASTSGAF